MKVNITHNKLRLRLSREDIIVLKSHLDVTTTCRLDKFTLNYMLKTGQSDQIDVNVDGYNIIILMPEVLASSWNEDQIGFQHKLQNGTLVLIERDLHNA